MKQYFYPTFIALVYLLSGCNFGKPKVNIDKKTLVSTWQLAHIEDSATETGNAKADLQNSARLASSLQDGVFYAFFEDGSYGKTVASEYETGSWDYNASDNVLQLHPLGKSIEKLHVDNVDAAKKMLTINAYDAKVKLSFKQISPLKDEKTDPLHPQNNLWRLKATSKEDEAALLKRLKNLLQHYIYLLEASEERKENIINFGQSISFIKIYSGGIGIEENVENPAWKKIFYDEKDEILMNQLFVNLITKSGTLQLGSSGSWVKDDILLLKTLYGNMEKFYH